MTTAHAVHPTAAETTVKKIVFSNRDLTEYCDSRGVNVRVDRERSMIHGVKILGIRSRNGRTYRPTALQNAVRLYEGAPVNINHPKGHPSSPRDYQDRIGRIENVAYRQGEGLFGDFRFNPKHQLVEQLLWDAEHAAENVGFSHNVQARVAQQDKQLAVEAITKVTSVDLVADPATTNGLFESTNSSARTDSDSKANAHKQRHSDIEHSSPSIVEVTLADLKKLRPDLVEGITEEKAHEVLELRQEVDRLQATEAVSKKHSLAYALLEEFDLPRPHSDDPIAQAITSDLFFESLIAASNDSAMRTLVEERAALAKHIQRNGTAEATSPSAPLCRDPDDVYGHTHRLDTSAFIESIT